jgi:hypothetical protein
VHVIRLVEVDQPQMHFVSFNHPAKVSAAPGDWASDQRGAAANGN